MIAKKKMDDYNWPDLYRQSDEFMRQYIPQTMIHARYRLLFDGRPAVTVHFPEKGHKQELNLLQKKACFRRIRGTTVNGVRLIYANIYFTADGSRIYGEEEKTIKQEDRQRRQNMLLSPTTSPGLILLFSFFIGWQIGKKRKQALHTGQETGDKI